MEKWVHNYKKSEVHISIIAVYGETVRYPLYIERYIRIIKFWEKYHTQIMLSPRWFIKI